MRLRFFTLLAALACLTTATTHAIPFDNIVSLNFDLDGNLLNLDAPAVIFHKTDGSELLLSHSEYAQHYLTIGKTTYVDYEVRIDRTNPLRHTYRYTESVDKNHLLDQIAVARAHGKPTFFASQYMRYYHALRNPRTRPWVHIITARGTSPEYLREGQELLVRSGLAPTSHAEGTLMPVTYLQSPTGHLNAPEGKAIALMGLLDRIAEQPITRRTSPLWDSEGRARRPMHYLEFSDDTSPILRTVMEQLIEQKQKGRWPNIKIRLLYTGHHPEAWPLTDFVLTDPGSGQPIRPTRPEEIGEIHRWIGISPLLTQDSFCKALLRSTKSAP